MTSRPPAAIGTSLQEALRRAAAAAGDFLRGYTGIRGADPLRSDAGASGAPQVAPGDDSQHSLPTAAEVRRALAERAARRPTCC